MKQQKSTNLKPIQCPNVVRSGSVDYNYYVNETVTCLKSMWYTSNQGATQVLNLAKSSKHTHIILIAEQSRNIKITIKTRKTCILYN